MTEREQTVQRLMEVQGLPREEAELRVQDDDLWLVDAELRVGLEGQAAVEEWEEAAAFASAINRTDLPDAVASLQSNTIRPGDLMWLPAFHS
jgi:hypothetical protein